MKYVNLQRKNPTISKRMTRPLTAQWLLRQVRLGLASRYRTERDCPQLIITNSTTQDSIYQSYSTLLHIKEQINIQSECQLEQYRMLDRLARILSQFYYFISERLVKASSILGARTNTAPFGPTLQPIQNVSKMEQLHLEGKEENGVREEMSVENIRIVLIQSFYCKNYKNISMSKKQVAKAPEPAKITGFDPKKYAVNGVSEEEVKAIKQAFDLFDSDQGGSVDIKELKAAMTSLGFQSKSQSIFQMISDLDADGNGSIDFGEWFNLMTKRVNDRDSKENINKIFLLFDDERTGFLNVGNLKRIAESLGDHVSDEELHELITRADTDHDGLVSFDEFYTILTRKVKD